MRVRDPRGQTWRVTRRWVPWRRRLRGLGDLGPDVPAPGDDPVSQVLAVVALVAAIPFLLLSLLVGAELLLVLLLLPVAVLARVALGRHWHVEVRRGFRPVHDEAAGGWRESGARIRALAEGLQRGEGLPRPGGVRRE